MAGAQVDIVTINWNAGEQLAACVVSTFASNGASIASFTVVDNGSTDGSARLAVSDPRLAVDETGENLGFGRACNRGARRGDAPYLLFLNPDTRLDTPAIAQAVAFLESAGGQGYAACGIQLIDDDARTTRHCAPLPTSGTFICHALGLDRLAPGRLPSLLMENFDHRESRDVGHVQGAFYLVRRAAFDAVGGFDEDYFVYMEDLDLSHRLQARGWKIRYLADAVAWHRGGGTSHQVKARARFYSIEGRLLYARKNFGRAGRLAHALVTYLAEPPAALLWYAVKHRGRGLGAVSRSTLMLLRDTPRLIASGRAER